MDGDDNAQGPRHVLVATATTFATLLVASAVVWRHRSQSSEPLPELVEEKPVIAARPKERRRRGKDPLKDILKGGKKAKAVEKLIQGRSGSERENDGDRDRDQQSPSRERPMVRPVSRSVSSTTTADGSITSASEAVESVTSIESVLSSESTPTPVPPSVITFPGPWDEPINIQPPPRPARSKSHSKVKPVDTTVSNASALLNIPSASSEPLLTPNLTPAPSPLHSTPSESRSPSTSSIISVSTQTQIASLKGALEAARLREEQARLETWEARRREGELQAQIHHLVHQLQSYAAVFVAMSPPPPPFSATPIPMQSSPSFPSPLTMPFPYSPAQSHPPTGPFSPNHSPFFNYPSTPSPNPAVRQRERERGRRRTKTAEARLGGSSSGEGWEEQMKDGEGDDEDEGESEEEELNDILADAILKRPGSIRMGSKKSSRKKIPEQLNDSDEVVEKSEEQVEFTFPSLVDMHKA